MAITPVDRTRLRALSEVSVPSGRVVSLYLDLDPATFAAPPARASEIRSLVDELGRRIDELADDLEHDELVALRADRDRIEAHLTGELDAKGARGVAVFACGPSGLWEVIRVPHPVPAQVTIDVAPHVDPLVRDAQSPEWAVAVVSRATGRLLRGTTDRLVEILVRDDDVPGRHDQGGLSQSRYQRRIDRKAGEHVGATMEQLYREFQDRPFDHLVVVAAAPMRPDIEHGLHPDLARRLAGWVDADAEDLGPNEVLELVRPEMERLEAEREEELRERLDARLATDEPAVAGLQPTLDMLHQARVETLLLLDGFEAPGATCPACGWMGAGPEATTCPVDGRELERREDVAEAAIASAVQQDADVVRIRRRDDPGDPDSRPQPSFVRLQDLGGIAALLRF
jgi:peptide chain release factor subunit 1